MIEPGLQNVLAARLRQWFDFKASEAAGAPPPDKIAKACHEAITGFWLEFGDDTAEGIYRATRKSWEAQSGRCAACGEDRGMACRCPAAAA